MGGGSGIAQVSPMLSCLMRSEYPSALAMTLSMKTSWISVLKMTMLLARSLSRVSLIMLVLVSSQDDGHPRVDGVQPLPGGGVL